MAKKSLYDRIKDVDPKKLEAALAAIDQPVTLSRHEYHKRAGRRKHLTFGVVGDTHIGSKYFDQEALDMFYQHAADRGVDFMLQVGDIVEGQYSKRAGHVYELDAIGYDQQLQAVIDLYPEIEGVKTLFITGNHDETFIKDGGANIGDAIAKYRPDMDYLGHREADLLVGPKGKTTLRILHPGGGTAYAISYKPQKIVESYGGDEKPHALFIGHFHKWEHLFYRNVHVLQAGTFQSQSEFMRVHALAAHKAGTIVSMEVNATGDITRFGTEIVPFYQ